ncbi:MAG: ATP-binding cassette domain-containing protein [Pseudobdellovibrionaceae bacterium]
MNLLQLRNGFKQYGLKILFNNASFAVNEGEHIGVIGPNGAGKTTLFKILVGHEALESGDLIQAQKLKVGYLEQESDWALDLTAEVYFQESCIKPLWDLKQLGKGLGLFEDHFKVPMRSLSGGYRMRMKLLYLIGQEPNLMLLDEPTNFLDLESVMALEKFLQDYTGAFLLISHDREFLRRTTEATLEVEGGDLTKYPGNIDDYFEQKSSLREILEAQVANQDSKRKQVLEFVERFGAKATKAKQAQSRLKQLDKMEKIVIKKLPVTAKIQIPDPISTGKDCVSLSNANLGYNDRVILRNVNFTLERGKKIGVVGFNGAGKSTLLKSLATRVPLLTGEIKFGYQVSFSYFAQHLAEDLSPEDTVLSSLQKEAHPSIKAQEILNLAGSLLFSGDQIYKKVKVLSGGEKSRVALGQVLLKKNPLILMDEPTNHLDFETVEALTQALCDFAGTVVVVSHDRSFIGRVATSILEIRDGEIIPYPGTYDDYLWSLEKGALSQRPTTSPYTNDSKSSNFPFQPEKTNTKFNYKEEAKKINSELKELQKKMRRCEDVIKTEGEKRELVLSKLLSAKGVQAQDLAVSLAATSNLIARTEEELLTHMEIQEAIEKKLIELKS